MYLCNCDFNSSKRTIEIIPPSGDFQKMIPAEQSKLIEAQIQQFCSTLEIKNIRFQISVTVDVFSLKEDASFKTLTQLPSFPTPSLISTPTPPTSLLAFDSKSFDSHRFSEKRDAFSGFSGNLSLIPSIPLFQPMTNQKHQQNKEETNQTTRTIEDLASYPKTKLERNIVENKKIDSTGYPRDPPKFNSTQIFNHKNVKVTHSTKKEVLEKWILDKFQNLKSRTCRTCPFFHDERVIMVHFHVTKVCTYAVSLTVWNRDSTADTFIYNAISTKPEKSVVVPSCVLVLLVCRYFVKINLRNYPEGLQPMSLFSLPIFSVFFDLSVSGRWHFCHLREMLQIFMNRKKIYFCALEGWKEDNYSQAIKIESAITIDALNLVTFILKNKIFCTWQELSGALSPTSVTKLEELQTNYQLSKRPKSHSFGGKNRSEQTKSQMEKNQKDFRSLTTRTKTKQSECEWESTDLSPWNQSEPRAQKDESW